MLRWYFSFWHALASIDGPPSTVFEHESHVALTALLRPPLARTEVSRQVLASTARRWEALLIIAPRPRPGRRLRGEPGPRACRLLSANEAASLCSAWGPTWRGLTSTRRPAATGASSECRASAAGRRCKPELGGCDIATMSLASWAHVERTVTMLPRESAQSPRMLSGCKCCEPVLVQGGETRPRRRVLAGGAVRAPDSLSLRASAALPSALRGLGLRLRLTDLRAQVLALSAALSLRTPLAAHPARGRRGRRSGAPRLHHGPPPSPSDTAGWTPGPFASAASLTKASTTSAAVSAALAPLPPLSVARAAAAARRPKSRGPPTPRMACTQRGRMWTPVGLLRLEPKGYGWLLCRSVRASPSFGRE